MCVSRTKSCVHSKNPPFHECTPIVLSLCESYFHFLRNRCETWWRRRPHRWWLVMHWWRNTRYSLMSYMHGFDVHVCACVSNVIVLLLDTTTCEIVWMELAQRTGLAERSLGWSLCHGETCVFVCVVSEKLRAICGRGSGQALYALSMHRVVIRFKQ